MALNSDMSSCFGAMIFRFWLVGVSFNDIQL